jgi:hypothetical protein
VSVKLSQLVSLAIPTCVRKHPDTCP